MNDQRTVDGWYVGPAMGDDPSRVWVRCPDGEGGDFPAIEVERAMANDPSGIDMTRDNEERLSLFAEDQVEVERLALNMDQIRKYRPPPNPAKMTDSRFNGYEKIHGKQSWELDALEPQMIANLVRTAILSVRDNGLWEQSLVEEEQGREELQSAMDKM